MNSTSALSQPLLWSFLLEFCVWPYLSLLRYDTPSAELSLHFCMWEPRPAFFFFFFSKQMYPNFPILVMDRCTSQDSTLITFCTRCEHCILNSTYELVWPCKLSSPNSILNAHFQTLVNPWCYYFDRGKSLLNTDSVVCLVLGCFKEEKLPFTSNSNLHSGL